MYENQDNSVNISSAALENLGDMRKFNKKKMEAAEHGSNDYIYYRILQLTYKVLMNSYYGILGERNSVFYSSSVQNSITTTGQDLITTSIIAMESFLSNNVPFNDTDDVITFLLNVKSEKHDIEIMNYVDAPITKAELLEYLINHKKPEAELDVDLISDIISKFDNDLLTRIYYKNQIIPLIHNAWFVEKLKNMSQYVYAEEPSEEMKEDLNDFREKVIDFCHYDYLYEDRYKRAMKDKRKCIITIDTDSNFINLDFYLKSVSQMLDLDKSNETQQMTIMNIFINVTTEVLKKTFWTLTTNMGLIDRCKPIINMKSEFIYQRILLTRNKKSYGGIVTGELGKLLSKPVLDIKGLSIRKTSVPKKIRKEFTEILENDILKAKDIDLKSIIDKYDALGLSIEASLKSGSTEYLLPKNLELIESYKTPETIESVRATILWNALEPEDTIVPPDKINIVKLNPDIAAPLAKLSSLDEIDSLLNDNDISLELKNLIKNYPSKAKGIAKVIYNIGNSNKSAIDISRFGMSCIAVPKGIEQLPEYLVPLIDYRSMVNNNMTNGYILLESLGIYVSDIKTVKYKSNIIQI